MAGRVVLRPGGRLLSRLGHIARDLLVIPSVAILRDRTGNKGTALNPAGDLLPLLGGSIGALAGMRVFHHKTRHWYFRWGIPAIFLLQLAACGAVWYLSR